MRRLVARVPLAGRAASWALWRTTALVRERVFLAGAVGGMEGGGTLCQRRDLMRRGRLVVVGTTLRASAVNAVWLATLGSGGPVV